jgi:hypothetical protein
LDLTLDPHAGRGATESNAAFASDGRRPKKKTSPVGQRSRLQRDGCRDGRGMKRPVMTAIPRRREAAPPSYSPLEGALLERWAPFKHRMPPGVNGIAILDAHHSRFAMHRAFADRIHQQASFHFCRGPAQNRYVSSGSAR